MNWDTRDIDALQRDVEAAEGCLGLFLVWLVCLSVAVVLLAMRVFA